MQDETNTLVDKYVPRRCMATNRIIAPHDHSSVQFEIARVDDEGNVTGEPLTVCFSGYVRSSGEADNALNRIATENKLLNHVYRAGKSK